MSMKSFSSLSFEAPSPADGSGANPPPCHGAGERAAFRQRGAVLLIALFVLIAMTLSALALIRSVSMTNLVSGNLAFRESAVHYAERAVEHAIAWLVDKANHTPSELWVDSDSGSPGYLAVRQDPDPASTDRRNWDELWRKVLESHERSIPSVDGGDDDPTGNRVAYVIQRLCEKTGTPVDDVAKCAKPPHDAVGGSKIAGGGGAGLTNPQIYYRITARVTGPRNTVVYTQMIIAL
jgi:Tfp pilus assembly protein PilX